ncbi:hypothetical protein [Aliiroseovarius sp. F20344]|uniref:hypothetical protein n=1 Tax=Aliiroseovarius sp. F20344 TaxID=2926414 RepID=UPI001FF6BC6B|nr:hypothetical protein [Aliiroseovarius sp. F20344]MCK0142771.1 hypothetical protein [Aliiroseovarius sp. F20344]
MTPAIWLNIVLMLVALLVAVFYLRRDHLREKANEDWVKAFTRYSKSDEFKQRNSYAAQYRKIPDPNDACPRLDRDGFTFEDVAQKAMTILPEFALPPLSIKRAIEPGDQVLLRVLWAKDIPDCDAWVRVTLVQPGDFFTGEIIAVETEEGVPDVSQDVAFTANHIALIDRPGLRPVPN